MSDMQAKARAAPAGDAAERLWRFQCPECGVGDQELGHLLTVDELHCDICIGSDEPVLVRLRRWREDPQG